MQHSYLRYECSDSFSLTCDSPLGSGEIITFPFSNRNLLLSCAGSQIAGFDLRRGNDGAPFMKLFYVELSTGGIGTGKALNSNQSTCIDSCSIDEEKEEVVRIGVGYMDGSIRIYKVKDEDLRGDGFGVLNSCLAEGEITNVPLVLNGHTKSPVSCVSFSESSYGRLASGGSDGCIIVWDLVSECGLFRLLGHSGGITSLKFIVAREILISTSLDNLVKLWDLDKQFCTQTIASHGSEIWSSCCLNMGDSLRFLTGSSDKKLRVWKILEKEEEEKEKEEDCFSPASFIGGVNHTNNERVSLIRKKKNVFAVTFHNSKCVEVYSFRSKEQVQKRLAKRIKRRNKRKKSQEKGMLDDESSEEEEEREEGKKCNDEVVAGDEIEFWDVIKASHKVKSLDFLSLQKTAESMKVKVALALGNNSIELYTIEKFQNDKNLDIKPVSTFNMYGHPTGIRSISLSNDNDPLACTISKGCLKIWNISCRTCIRSFLIKDYALCCLFLPGNTHVVIGTREGHLLIFDIPSGEVVFREDEAHEAAIWDVDLIETCFGGGNFISGSADHTVKFWDLEEQQPNEQIKGNHPALIHIRTLKMNDDILSVRFSHQYEKETQSSSSLLVAVATLDCTIKVFFHDSLKFFLSLYGHTLPALAIDISFDDTLLISGGADKTIKIWGLDFGDSHRTLYGHDDSITNLKFVCNTHYFFSCSKDKTVRYWDADRFEQIMILSGHSAELHALAVSPSGAFVISAGMDRQVRVWERTQDILFLEEEKELQLEANILQKDFIEDFQNHTSIQSAVKRSILSVEAGDRIMEALEIADQDLKQDAIFKASSRGNEKRTPNKLMFGLPPSLYMLKILKSVQSAELEPSILILPIHYIERLIHYLILLLRMRRGVELCSRIAILLVRSHQNEIIATNVLATPVRELRKLIKIRLEESRNTFGFNLVALKAITKLAHEQKNNLTTETKTDIWAGMGVGSDIAAALQRTKKRK